MLITIAILQLAGANPMLTKGASRLSATDPAPIEAKRSPYRIESEAAGASSKDRAIQDNGTRCSVVGSRVCTRKPRTVFSAPIGN